MGTAILVTSSIVQVVVIILISAGQVGQAREPQVEGMEDWLEFEMRGQDQPESPKRAIKHSVIWIP